MGGSPVYCRMFTSIPSAHQMPLVGPSHNCNTKNVSKYWQVSSGVPKLPPVENHCTSASQTFAYKSPEGLAKCCFSKSGNRAWHFLVQTRSQMKLMLPMQGQYLLFTRQTYSFLPVDMSRFRVQSTLKAQIPENTLEQGLHTVLSYCAFS